MTAESVPIAQDRYVSIIMPTFNSARTVDRAVASVLAQTHYRWQIVWVDDGSADDTVARVSAWREPLGTRLVAKRLGTNGGPARARNQALDLCTGDWVAILDADDAWRPERLTTLLAAAAALGADGVCDNLLGFDDHRQKETRPLFEALPAWLTLSSVVAAEYQGRYNLGYLKPMVRRAFLLGNALRYDEALRTGEDLLLLLQMVARHGRIACVGTPGYVYTTPFGNLSRKLSRSSSTVPRDQDLAAALQRFLDEFGAGMPSRDVVAVRRRIDYLAAIATFSQFRHARLSRDWQTALRLLRHRTVRRQLLHSLFLDRWSAARRSDLGTL